MKKALVTVFVLVVIIVTYVATTTLGTSDQLQPQESPATANNKKVKIGEKELLVETATTPEQWRRGLSGRTKLDSDNGMLFIFPNNEIRSFWMKETSIPLDLIWIEDNKVVGIISMQPQLDVPDSMLRSYVSPSKVNAVIETNMGWAIKNNIKIGDILYY